MIIGIYVGTFMCHGEQHLNRPV